MPDAPVHAPPAALAMDEVQVSYRVRGRDRQVLRDVSFAIEPREAYGLVGESGCGKSTVAFAAMRYLAGNGRVTAGRIEVAGADVAGLDNAALRSLRAKSVSMVYQDPAKALNPTLTIGRQLTEACKAAGVARADTSSRAREMLERTRISNAGQVMRRYPHQLSGGMQQRVCIAMALVARPELLILDEPTTGLDATVEAEVLDLIAELRREFGAAVLFISHNLAVVARTCDRIGVLYAGMLIEEGTTADVFANPRHPYTLALLRCLPQAGRSKYDRRLESIPGRLPAPGAATPPCPFEPRCPLATDICRTVTPPWTPAAAHRVRCHHHDRTPELARRPPGGPDAPLPAQPDYMRPPRLRARALSRSFGVGAARFTALDGVSFDLFAGETLGVVGESGSGKSTLARIVLGLIPGDGDSTLALEGEALDAALDGRSRNEVKSLQSIFQNPDSALNRAHPVRRILGRAVQTLGGLRGQARDARLADLTGAVSLGRDMLSLRPRQLSGGLKQRVAIARAFAGDPRVVICDEPTSALDVSVQAVILNLLAGLQAERGVAYLFISHDLAVVRWLSDRIMVLFAGQVMEIGPAALVGGGPHHPYTEVLLAAAFGHVGGRVAGPDRAQRDDAATATGCPYHRRCLRYIGPVCDETHPDLAEVAPGHFVRCHLPADALGTMGAP